VTPQVATRKKTCSSRRMPAAPAGSRKRWIFQPGLRAGGFHTLAATGTRGITLSASTGTTPAQVQITVDPTVFQNAKGTTAVLLTVTSTAAVNLPPTVRLLINTRDVNQRGQILNVPGKDRGHAGRSRARAAVPAAPG